MDVLTAVLSPTNLPTAAIGGLLICVLIALPTWGVSLPLRDASVADRVWSAFIAAPAVWYVWQLGSDARSAFMVAITLLWALRLALHISIRNWGHGEDRRYQDMRQRNQPGFALKSLWLVFLLQAVLGWLVSLPFLAAAGPDRPVWGLLDTLGAVVATAGVLMESVADAQLARFRRAPRQADRVLDTGLWRYSRHPNYFGECCLWWGVAVMALSAAGGAGLWCLVSPVLMTVLLLKVSGVSLLEKDIGERRPAYRDYVSRTSAFIPWPPKRKGA
jgi:steroid 5-alpha reductase family enzyme